MRAKQKIVQGRGPSNINLGIFVCSFDVCRASQPVPYINYGQEQNKNIKIENKNNIRRRIGNSQPQFGSRRVF